MKKIKDRFKNFVKSNSLLIRITLIMLLIVVCLCCCFGYICGVKQSISVKADENLTTLVDNRPSQIYEDIEFIPHSTSDFYEHNTYVDSTYIVSTSRIYFSMAESSSFSLTSSIGTRNFRVRWSTSSSVSYMPSYSESFSSSNSISHWYYSLYSLSENCYIYNYTDYNSNRYVFYFEFYYDGILLMDSYSNYFNSNCELLNYISSLSVDYCSSSTSSGSRLGLIDGVNLVFSDVSIFSEYLPQLMSFHLYICNSSSSVINHIFNFGDYTTYNYIDDLDAYRVGYLRGYDDGVADTVSQYSGDGEDDGSYQEGYQDGYNIGYQSGLFSTVAQSYNWIVDYNYWVAPLKLTDSVNSIDLTNTNSYYYLGITFRLSSNFSVSQIASIDCCINNTPNSLIYNYYSDGTYDHPSGVGYGNINTYSSSSYETGGGSYSGSLSYPYIPYTISTSCQGWNIYDYSGYDSLDSPFVSMYSNLDITNVNLSSGDYCNSFNDFIEYNRQYYYSTDFDLYNSNATANNEISLYFIINSDQYNFDDMISNISLTVRLTDNTSHPIQKATWIQSLFSSSNSYVNFRTGYNLGYSSGFRVGESVGLTNSELLKDTMWAVMDSPFHMLKQVLNFNLLGINLWQVFTGVISVVLLIWLIKKFLV